MLTAEPWPGGVLMNVNLPDVTARRVTGIAVTRQGRRKIGSELAFGPDPRGEPYYWLRAQRRAGRYRPGSDPHGAPRRARRHSRGMARILAATQGRLPVRGIDAPLGCRPAFLGSPDCE